MGKETHISQHSEAATELHVELQVIASATELDAVRHWWRAFLDRPTVNAGFFTDPSVLGHDACFEIGGWLVLGKVHRNGDLVAIVPLIGRRKQVPIRLGLIRLLEPVARVAKLPDFEFPREEAVDPFEVFSAVLSVFREQSQQADIVMVDSAPEPPTGHSSSNFTVKDVQNTYVVEVEGDFGSYEQKLSSNSRMKIRRKVRQFEKTPGARVETICYRAPEEMDALREQLRRVWEKSWHARVGQQPVPSERFLKTLAQTRWIRCYALLVGEQPVASILGFQYRGTYYYEASAYDQEWQDRSPGTVLLYAALKDIFEQDRPARFDFGSGFNEYKQVFGTQEERRGSVRVSITMRGRLIVGLQTWADSVFRWSRVMLDWTGLPRWMKMRARKGK